MVLEIVVSQAVASSSNVNVILWVVITPSRSVLASALAVAKSIVAVPSLLSVKDVPAVSVPSDAIEVIDHDQSSFTSPTRATEEPRCSPSWVPSIRRIRLASWPEWMNTTTAANYLDMDEATLRRWRRQGQGPSYSKGERAVRYSRDDLDEYMASLKGGR